MNSRYQEPWNARAGAGLYVIDGEGFVIIEFPVDDYDDGNCTFQKAADAARLCAAAPDMLTALRDMVAKIESAAAAGIDLTGYVGTGAALAAIAKAEGRI